MASRLLTSSGTTVPTVPVPGGSTGGGEQLLSRALTWHLDAVGDGVLGLLVGRDVSAGQGAHGVQAPVTEVVAFLRLGRRAAR